MLNVTEARNTRVLGLDVGGRRIGVAICDDARLLATPYAAIQRRDQEKDIATIVKIVKEEEVRQVIVGLPLSLDGGIGPQAEVTLVFFKALEAICPVPTDTWDERYSTAEAEQRLIEAGVSPSRNKSRIDASAAAVILQSYLDSHRQASR